MAVGFATGGFLLYGGHMLVPTDSRAEIRLDGKTIGYIPESSVRDLLHRTRQREYFLPLVGMEVWEREYGFDGIKTIKGRTANGLIATVECSGGHIVACKLESDGSCYHHHYPSTYRSRKDPSNPLTPRDSKYDQWPAIRVRLHPDTPLRDGRSVWLISKGYVICTYRDKTGYWPPFQKVWTVYWDIGSCCTDGDVSCWLDRVLVECGPDEATRHSIEMFFQGQVDKLNDY
jgi:hypothetical protein